MTNVLDVAAYILDKAGPMSAMKLQKLAYYSQAWSLVWNERPLFDNKIEAWANGPVIPDLYNEHRGQFSLSGINGGSADKITDQDDITTIDSVINFYNQYSAQQLSELTHNELPWKLAREDYEPGERCNEEITLASMHEYYSSL